MLAFELHPASEVINSFTKVSGRRLRHDLNEKIVIISKTGLDSTPFKPLFDQALSKDVNDPSLWYLVAMLVSQPQFDAIQEQEITEMLQQCSLGW